LLWISPYISIYLELSIYIFRKPLESHLYIPLGEKVTKGAGTWRLTRKQRNQQQVNWRTWRLTRKQRNQQQVNWRTWMLTRKERNQQQVKW
jgi:hypothetical protein